ncbi:hypothetical protein [Mesorhizobium sp.]|uniref:hypothetical protein n=1 Tax=Mesorhizobium sp. TaxID=1871066 RepID=UPI0025F51B88|nr:hypothetical protein [Mesorhizobium sp.]
MADLPWQGRVVSGFTPGQRNGLHLWSEIKRRGFAGSKGDRLQVDRRTPAVLIDRSAKCAMAAAVAPKLCMAAERRPNFAR